MADKCVFSQGNSHPYNYCVKDLSEMIDYDKISRQKDPQYNTTGIAESTGALINYTSALVTNPYNTISDKCKNVQGNRYILKTQIKCKDGVNNVHTFIDNIPGYNVITGRYDPDVGIIPAAIGSAAKIPNGAVELMESLSDEANPECIEVKLPCHVVDKNNPNNSYNGPSNFVHIAKREYDKLIMEPNTNEAVLTRWSRAAIFGEEDGIYSRKPGGEDWRRARKPLNEEGFKNIYDALNNYFLNNEINDNNYNDNNYNDNNNKILKEGDDLNQDILVNTYYLFLSLFFLFITYKLLIKK